MDALEKWIATEYKILWHKAYNLGVEAREAGKPRECNLTDSPFVHNGQILKVYKSAWEQGWDGYQIPEVFGIMQKLLDKLPTRKSNELL